MAFASFRYRYPAINFDPAKFVIIRYKIQICYLSFFRSVEHNWMNRQFWLHFSIKTSTINAIFTWNLFFCYTIVHNRQVVDKFSVFFLLIWRPKECFDWKMRRIHNWKCQNGAAIVHRSFLLYIFQKFGGLIQVERDNCYFILKVVYIKWNNHILVCFSVWSLELLVFLIVVLI